MYCDPFQAEGLFPLAEDDNKTERDLPYEFKPGVDYFARFDAMLPAWRPSHYEKLASSEAAWTEEAGGPVEVRVGRRQTRTLSHRRYMRAIHPDGSLRQLVVSTVRATPAFPDGRDACATEMRFVAKKSGRGWIVVENVDWAMTPYSGKRGQEYAAWALAVMEYRQKRHAAEQSDHDKGFETKHERAMNRQTDVIAKALTAALAPREAEAPKGRPRP